MADDGEGLARKSYESIAETRCMKEESVADYLHCGPATDFTNARDRRARRAFEMLPGALTWATLLGMVGTSLFAPASAAFFIIAFDIYWVMNAAYFAAFIIGSVLRMRRAIRVDWPEQLRRLDPSSYRLQPLEHWQELLHLVVLPMYREGPEILGPTLETLAASRYPLERIFVVLATEERGGEEAQRTASLMRDRWATQFGAFLVTRHPADMPDEIPGKGSNETYAVKEAIRLLLDPRGVPYRRVIVSSFDSDTRVLPDYFACLTYHFLTTPDPLRASYQPVPLFNNNIWEAPAFSRLPAIGSTAWQLFMQTQPHLQETFSSHSMSLQTLVDIGFWNRRLVNEDSIIFWQCYLFYDGNYRVVPLFYPVSMDANVARTWRRTAVNVYRQHRRWAYGVEKIPFVFFGFMKNHRIPLRRKLSRGFRLVFGFWMWSCASLLLLSLGWLPVVIGGDEFRQTVLAFNLPRWTRNLMIIASLGLLVNGALTFLLLPPLPKDRSRFTYVGVVLQWFFLPLSTIFFGSLPAIDAQTRLMLGKYLGFWVTEKVRRRPKSEHEYLTANPQG